MGERLSLVGFRLGWRLVRLLPEWAAYALFTLIADVVWRLDGAGVQRLQANLARVVPERSREELRALTRAGMRSYLRYWCDSFRLPGWDVERTVGTVRLVNGEILWTAHNLGRGLVVALAHQGNWDHAGAWSTHRLAKVVTVAERLEPAGLFDQFVAYRESLGMEILALTSKNGAGGGVLPTLIRRVHDGGFVPLLMDRDLTGTGTPVTFFGHTAHMATGPAALAIATRAPLLPVNIHYERLPKGSAARWGLVITMHPAVAVPELPADRAQVSRKEQIQQMTQACADALASGIRQHPQDWHMLQRVFDDDLDRTKNPAQASAPGERQSS